MVIDCHGKFVTSQTASFSRADIIRDELHRYLSRDYSQPISNRGTTNQITGVLSSELCNVKSNIINISNISQPIEIEIGIFYGQNLSVQISAKWGGVCVFVFIYLFLIYFFKLKKIWVSVWISFKKKKKRQVKHKNTPFLICFLIKKNKKQKKQQKTKVNIFVFLQKIIDLKKG